MVGRLFSSGGCDVLDPLLNKPRVGVGDVPEVFEKEPNDTPSEAEAVSIPVTINGHIDNPSTAKHADDDYFASTPVRASVF